MYGQGGTIFTSNQIAQMTAPMASPISSMASNPFYDQAVGGVMSRIGSVGGSLIQGGMGLMGVDPFSLGMSAFSGALRGGAGLAGAGMAGMGAAAAVGLPMMAASYAGNQMFTGMQQQQQLNSTLRQNFNYLGPNGQGFNSSQMASIGSGMRQMTHEFGPGGEMASYKELTALAGQMGQMGMAKGVREVQDFTKKFKEMVETAKTMARDLGTTLEGAVQTMQSLRNSGIFKATDQAKFTGLARNTALSGGLAMTEVMGMASIGSQLSRSVGGTGQQGAFAGMRAIGTVGTAAQIGAISDEDIYNSTGLTGAAGRQAFATNMLQADASFLKSSRGRRLIAAMAGKNGQLDENLAGEFAAGGFSIGRTMELDQQNLSKIGRANFIRNEGRLRGAVLERFGGNVNVMSLMGWAGGKGIDINDMDDRSMLFAQRQLGMGRDEFETALKMAQNLPNIMVEQANRQRDDTYLQKRADYQKTHGLQGLKTKFDQVTERINSGFQQAGANIMNAAEDTLEQWVNEISGQYYQHISAGVDVAIKAAQKGDMSKANRIFSGASGMIRLPGQGGYGELSSGKSMLGKIGGALGLNGASSDLRAAGYSTSWMSTDNDLQQKMKSVQAGQNAAMEMVDEKLLGQMNTLQGDAKKFWAFGVGDAKGDALHKKFGKFLGDQAMNGNEQARSLLMQFENGDSVTKARIMHASSVGVGGEYGSVAERLGKGSYDALTGTSGDFTSPGQRNAAYFKAMMGGDIGMSQSTGHKVASGINKGVVLGGLAVASSGVGLLVGAGMVAQGLGLSLGLSGIQNAVGNAGRDQDQALADYLGGDDFVSAAKDALSNDAATRAKFRKDSLRKGLMNGGFKSAAEKQAHRMLNAASEYAEASQKGEVSEHKAKAILESYGIEGYTGSAVETLNRYVGGAGAAVNTAGKEARRAANRQLRTLAKADIDAMHSAGVATVGADESISLSAFGKASLEGLSDTQKDVIEKTLGVIQEGSKLDDDSRKTGGHLQGQADLSKKIAGMSVSEQRKLAAQYRKMGLGTQASVIEGRAMMVERTKAALSKKGTVATVAQELGADMSNEQMADVNKLVASGKIEEATNVMMSHAGLSGDEARRTMRYALDSKFNSGNKESIASAIQGIKGSDEAVEKRKAADKKQQEANNPLMAEVRDLLVKVEANTANAKGSLNTIKTNTADVKKS